MRKRPTTPAESQGYAYRGIGQIVEPQATCALRRGEKTPVRRSLKEVALEVLAKIDGRREW
jgi:hypothetical protein